MYFETAYSFHLGKCRTKLQMLYAILQIHLLYVSMYHGYCTKCHKYDIFILFKAEFLNKEAK